MNETVFNYVRKFYTRAIKQKEDISKSFISLELGGLSQDMFFKNWTVNFHNGGDPEYRLWDGTKIDSYKLYQLVHEDWKKGFFDRDMREHSVHFHITELGRAYLEFKLEL